MSSFSQIPPEANLLLSLCHYPSGVMGNEVLNIKDSFNRDLFLTLAREHGIEAVVWDNLKDSAILKMLPLSVTETLKASSAKSLARNTFIATVVGEALTLLRENDIEPVMLKGMALEYAWYGGRGLRQMTDADILIPREQALKARRLLLQRGFTSLPMKSLFHRPIMLHIGKHLPSLLKNGIMVEIHHDLFGREHEKITQELYESRRSASGIASALSVPDTVYLFVYLVSHLLSHEQNNESQLRLYLDLNILGKALQEENRLDEMKEVASRAGIRKEVIIKIDLLNEFLNAGIDIGVSAEDTEYRKARERFIFFLTSPKNNPVTERDNTYRETISAVPGLHRKFLFILGDLFPTISFMKKRYRKKSLFGTLLFYPHRWGKLVWLIR